MLRVRPVLGGRARREARVAPRSTAQRPRRGAFAAGRSHGHVRADRPRNRARALLPRKRGDGVSPLELPMAAAELPVTPARPARDEGWLRAAKRARQLSWASLVWMSIEGLVGLVAG